MNYPKELIRDLIKDGFTIGAISFELGISLDELMEISEELNLENPVTKNNINRCNNTNKSKHIDTENNTTKKQKNIYKSNNANYSQNGASTTSSFYTLQRLKDKYNLLYYSNVHKKIKYSQLSEEEIKYGDKVVVSIEGKVNNIKNVNLEIQDSSIKLQEAFKESEIDNKKVNFLKRDIINKKRTNRKNGSEILYNIKELENHKLTIEQAEKIILLLNSPELQFLEMDTEDRISFYLNNARNRVVRKLAEAVDSNLDKLESVEELKSMQKRLYNLGLKGYEFTIESVKGKINSKIEKLQQCKILEQLKNNIPKELVWIVEDLANGTLDIRKANEIITQVTKKNISNRESTVFTLNEEQERSKLVGKIKSSLSSNAKKYEIVNPENTIVQLHALCGGNITESLSTVIRNLIERKEYEKAKNICQDFSKRDTKNLMSKNIRIIERQINAAEIGDFVLKGITMKGTTEQEVSYFNLLMKGIQESGVRLQFISLGKSADGLRNITLADVWPEEYPRFEY